MDSALAILSFEGDFTFARVFSSRFREIRNHPLLSLKANLLSKVVFAIFYVKLIMINRRGISMEISKEVLFKWYNDEIKRYRDHEWQIAVWEIGIITAILLFFVDPSTKCFFPTCWLILPIAISIIIATYVEYHTHLRLAEFRQLTKILLTVNNFDILTNPNTQADKCRVFKKNGAFFQGISDRLYFCCFTLFPVLYGIIIIIQILNQSVGIKTFLRYFPVCLCSIFNY